MLIIIKKGKRNTRSWKWLKVQKKKDGKKIIIFNLKRHNIKIK